MKKEKSYFKVDCYLVISFRYPDSSWTSKESLVVLQSVVFFFGSVLSYRATLPRQEGSPFGVVSKLRQIFTQLSILRC